MAGIRFFQSASLLALTAYIFLLFPSTRALHAQQPDSARTAAPDTLRPLLIFSRSLSGRPAHRGRPARRPALDAVGLLAEVPGSFAFDFSTPGWPDGWSPLGLSPQRVSLHLDAWSFDDPVTGRPRYDLLPLAFLEPLHLGPSRYGAPATVHAQTRPYRTGAPLTELRYRAGGTGLQSIMALHVQQRRLTLFGEPGLVQILGGYGGHASQGVYQGSRLKRMRQLYTRLRYQQPGWAVEIANLHNRHRIGAHAGVEPQAGQPFSTIYNPRAATVRQPNARRQTLRNDLAVTGRARLAPHLPPPALSAYWSSQTFRYGLPSDTLFVKTNRFGLRLQQRLHLGSHHLHLRLEGWTDRLRDSNALSKEAGFPPRLHAALRDSLQLLGLQAVLEGALHASDDLPLLTGIARLEHPLGPLHLFGEAALNGQRVPLLARRGFGDFLTPVPSLPTSRLASGKAGVSLQAGPFDMQLFAFGHHLNQGLDYYVDEARETVTARTAPDYWRAGLGGHLGWRRGARRGLYLTLQPTLTRLIAPQPTPVHERLAASLPRVFGSGRLGARFYLFTDLDLDVYLEGRLWSSFRSRTLHPPTGLLALPPEDAPAFGPSGTLDMHVEAGLRSATLFLSYENMLSDTPLMNGTLLVPVYPLPSRRFRFGVFWPISG